MRNKIEWGKEDEHKEKTEYFCFGFAIGTHAFISTFNAAFFDRQIQENERNYLQVAMKTVRNDMENRMDEMRKTGLLFAGDSDINKAMYDDRNRLAMALNNLKRNFNYLDYVVIVDRENRILASSSPYLLYPDGSAVKILAASSMLFGKMHVSEEVVGLEELFTKDSFEYDNFFDQNT